VTDACRLLARLVGQPLRTLTYENPNRVLRLEGGHAIVETQKNPSGAPVPVRWVQDAIDGLYRDGELRVNKATLRHRRTAFVGAVLRELPDVEVLTKPQRLRVTR